MVKSASQERWVVLILALLYPSLLTWAYFVAPLGPGSATPQVAYAVGKTVQFGFPLVWLLLVLREHVAWPFRRRGLRVGLAFGFLVLAGMLVLYQQWLRPAEFFGPEVMQAIRAKVGRLNLNSSPRFIAVGVFYSLIHSLLEEYYWRWFVFGRLRTRLPRVPAIGVGSLGFMAHHVILLGTFFGWSSPWTWLFSAGVAVGGAFWAWLYDRSGSLLGPWLGHVLVDAGIFLVGYDLLRSGFTG